MDLTHKQLETMCGFKLTEETAITWQVLFALEDMMEIDFAHIEREDREAILVILANQFGVGHPCE